MRWVWVWVGGSAAAACAGLAVALYYLPGLEKLSWIAGAGSFVTAVPSLVLALVLARAQTQPPPTPSSAEVPAGGVANSVGDVSGSAVQAREVGGPVQQVSGNTGDTYTAHTMMFNQLPPAEQPPGALDRVASAVRVGQADPRELGVHAARPGSDGSALPPYVARDVDAELEQHLTRAASGGRPVLVAGDSTAGKSRAALQALKNALPGRRLIAPSPSTDLHALAARLTAPPLPEGGVVVWLDDLHRYLGLGRIGLTEDTLQALRRAGAAVVATMRSEFLDAYRPGALATTGQEWLEVRSERDDTAALLKCFDTVEVDRVWSAGETDRAAAVGDERLDEAVARHGVHGIAEYLAAGPDLLAEWRNARRSSTRGGHPRGHALVAAAVDLARTGLLAALTRQILQQAHRPYLAGAAALRPEPFDDALDWAQQVRLGVSSLLVPADGDQECWRAFDYLVEAATAPIPAPTWQTALACAAGDDERITIADNADEAGHRDTAVAVCEPLARDGHPRAMNLMGIWAEEGGNPDQAEAWYRRAVDAGHTGALFNLGLLLDEQDRPQEAEEAYRRAVDAGNTKALNNLGLLLADQGRAGEAEAWYRRAADAGHTKALFNLGLLLAAQDRSQEAEAWYRRAVDAGDIDALLNLGLLLAAQDRLQEAEAWYRRAADAGHTKALFNLGVLLAAQDRSQEAEEAYRRAVDAGDTDALFNLGVLLAAQDRPQEAEGYFRRAVDAGYTGALNNLGVLLAGQRRVGEAEEAYRRAADAGHTKALNNLGLLLAGQGRAGEAETRYRRAADAGDTGALFNLGVLLAAQDRSQEAEAWYRRAADAGHIDALLNLGVLLAAQDRPQEAEGYFRRAVDAGHTKALFNLGVLLAGQGRVGEAVEALERAVEAFAAVGDVDKQRLAAELLAELRGEDGEG
ncbi:hypothetical protein HDA32_004639 [Spinactinospora alkalitolerans]|uniref:Uncharacterized protein n=1 Tax=Spinactinospora alkalitolerans TaxID=687207 RepID=A0A852TZU2_9ACTN|nr:tetratricopeptide repeat protein [Spinactinospora alkalitolerans]NYE49519.1 hypothetical protein [Spinactinospora alkalitolerans]